MSVVCLSEIKVDPISRTELMRWMLRLDRHRMMLTGAKAAHEGGADSRRTHFWPSTWRSEASGFARRIVHGRFYTITYLHAPGWKRCGRSSPAARIIRAIPARGKLVQGIIMARAFHARIQKPSTSRRASSNTAIMDAPNAIPLVSGRNRLTSTRWVIPDPKCPCDTVPRPTIGRVTPRHIAGTLLHHQRPT